MTKGAKIGIIVGGVLVAGGIGFYLYNKFKGVAGTNTNTGGTTSTPPVNAPAATPALAIKTADNAKTYLITPSGQKYGVPSQERFLEITGHNTWDYPISIVSAAELAAFPTAVSWG